MLVPRKPRKLQKSLFALQNLSVNVSVHRKAQIQIQNLDVLMRLRGPGQYPAIVESYPLVLRIHCKESCEEIGFCENEALGDKAIADHKQVVGHNGKFIE